MLPFLIRCRSLARFKQSVLEACSPFPVHSRHSATTERRVSATRHFLPSRPSRLSILQVNHYRSSEDLAILTIPVIHRFLRLSHSPVLSRRPLTSTHLRLSCSALHRATETVSRRCRPAYPVCSISRRCLRRIRAYLATTLPLLQTCSGMTEISRRYPRLPTPTIFLAA